MGDRFQLVLQFSPWDGVDFERLVSLENELIGAISEPALVDGHDMGSNEANIFIHTPEPQTTLAQCVPVIDRLGLLAILSAGHRSLSGERYARDWPRGDDSAFSVK